MRSKYILGLAIIGNCAILIGCLPEPLPVGNVPQLEPRIVVSSQIVPGRGLVVFVTKSVGALDAGRESDREELINQVVISDAIVTLHQDDEVDTLIALGNGFYGDISEAWQEGVSYELHVKTDSLGEVSAISKVTERIPFSSASARIYYTGYDSLLQVDYGLNDPEGRNYYMINIQRFSTTEDISSLLTPRIFTHLIEDNDFNGKYFQDEFKVFFQDFSKGDTVAVFLSNVNEDYYKFLKLRNDNRYNVADFASEPANYPTNVKGGYGFFNLHLPDVRIFVLE
jgi:hypothetical protein